MSQKASDICPKKKATFLSAAIFRKDNKIKSNAKSVISSITDKQAK